MKVSNKTTSRVLTKTIVSENPRKLVSYNDFKVLLAHINELRDAVKEIQDYIESNDGR